MKSPLLLTAQIGFVLLTIVYFYFFLKELVSGINRTTWTAEKKQKFKQRVFLIPILLTILVSAWSLSGIMSDFSKFPFNLMPVLAVPLITAVVITFNSSFNEVLANVPLANIVRLQGFRFFVEILLWMLFIEGVLPEQMSFEGRNFDILAGITAPFIAWLISRKKISRAGLIIWNLVCLGLLINIVTIAILSTPSPVRIFMEEPSNTIVAYFPVSLLPGLLVPLAYTLHFFSLRQLNGKAKNVVDYQLS
jgi:hypothetical protein